MPGQNTAEKQDYKHCIVTLEGKYCLVLGESVAYFGQLLRLYI